MTIAGRTMDDHAACAAEDHLPLVAALVRRFPASVAEKEELYQQGCVGLMKAIARYDPQRGASFSAYAAAMILGEMRMLSRLNAPVHIPRTDRERRRRLRMVEDTLMGALGRPPTIQELSRVFRTSPEELILLMEEISVSSYDGQQAEGAALINSIADDDDWITRLEIRDLISHLPARDQRLMRLRYLEGLSQAETAARIGMTQVQVSRREMVLRRELQKAWKQAEK